VNPEQPEAIAQAMADIVQPALAQSLAEQSQAILAQYTWEASAQMHERHYAQLLRSKQIEASSHA
jgi:glycosyltransferase involved in cell wall biosynthesis